MEQKGKYYYLPAKLFMWGVMVSGAAVLIYLTITVMIPIIKESGRFAPAIPVFATMAIFFGFAIYVIVGEIKKARRKGG